MAKKPKEKKAPADLMGPLQGHLRDFEQKYGDDALKWYKSFLAAGLTVLVLTIFYFIGSLINWWIVYIIAGVTGLSLLFKVLFWGDDNW